MDHGVAVGEPESERLGQAARTGSAGPFPLYTHHEFQSLTSSTRAEPQDGNATRVKTDRAESSCTVYEAAPGRGNPRRLRTRHSHKAHYTHSPPFSHPCPSRRARSAPVQCRRITHSPETFSYLTCTTLTCPSSAGGALPSPRQSQRSDHMHRKGIVQKRPAERVQSRPHENARHKRRRACAPRLAQVPCHWSHGPGTRTNCNATRRHRSRANARRARGTCRRFARTARMGSGRRRPSGAGPCGQSASEPSRSSTASCRRRDPGLYPSSLPHCTRTTNSATPLRRKSAHACQARGTCRRFARTARMGSGRRRPSGAGPCGQSASEPSRSSTASCRRRDPGLYPSSLPHCTYTTNSATPRRRKSAGGHRGPGCCQKSCRNYHIGRSEGIRWQSDGNQRSSEGDRRAMAIRWQSDGNQRSSEDDRRASDGNQLQSARPLLEPPKPGMLSKGLGAPFAHVQPLLVLWGRPSVPSTETRGAGRAQSTRTIRT